MPHATEGINYHLMEIHYGHFERLFQFSFNHNKDDIKATYDKGFLIIEMKHRHASPTQVTVEIIGAVGRQEE